MQSILSKARASSIIAAVVFLLFAYFLANAVAQLSGNFSLGMLARTAIPIAAIAVVLLLVAVSKGMPIGAPNFSLKHVLAVSGIALPATAFVLAASAFDPTLFLIIGGVAAAFVISAYLCLTSRGTYALVIFLLIFPLLSYLEYYFVPISELKIGPFAVTPSILYIVFLCLLIPLTLKRGEGSRTFGSLAIPVASGAFVLVSFLSSLVSTDPLRSLGGFWLEVLAPFLMLPVVLRFAKTERDVATLAWALLAMVAGITFITLYFFGRYFGMGRYTSVYDLGSILLFANMHGPHLALMILMAFPLGIAMLSTDIKGRLKALITVALGLLIAGLLLSFNRTGVFAAGLSNSIFFFNVRSRRLLLTGVVLFLGLSLISSPFLRDIVLYRFRNVERIGDIFQDTSLRYRTYGWVAALKMVRDYPAWGIGFGLWMEYIPRYGRFQPVVTGSKGQRDSGYIGDAHNYYLFLASSAGVPALLAWLSLLALVLREGVYVIARSRDPAAHQLALGAVAGMIGVIFASLFEGGMHTGVFIGMGIVFWTLVGLIVVLGGLTKTQESGEAART